MARPLRIEYKNAFYHVISRGERHNEIFCCDEDREKFIEKLGAASRKYQLVIHAYVLMDNHYHLLIETPQGNLSKAMHYFNASYSNWFRCKYQIKGSVFQSRYKAVLVEKDEYLKVLSAYIHLNPLRARIVDKPEKYRYSSLRYYLGGSRPPSFLKILDILDLCGGRREYKRFIMSYPQAGAEINKEEIYGQNSILGSRFFLKQTYERIRRAGKGVDVREYEGIRDAKRIEGDDIFEILMADMKIPEDDLRSRKRGNVYRKLLVYGLRRYTDLSLKEIGELMNMDYGAVSELARVFEREKDQKKEYARLAKVLEREVAKRRLLNPC